MERTELRSVCKMVVEALPGKTESYQSGSVEVFGEFIRAVMDMTHSKADFHMTNDILREMLDTKC